MSGQADGRTSSAHKASFYLRKKAPKMNTKLYSKILMEIYRLEHQSTSLFEIIVGVLTTCHTQYT